MEESFTQFNPSLSLFTLNTLSDMHCSPLSNWPSRRVWLARIRRELDEKHKASEHSARGTRPRGLNFNKHETYVLTFLCNGGRFSRFLSLEAAGASTSTTRADPSSTEAMAITLQDYVVPGLCVIPLASASVPCHALLGEVMTTHEHRKPGNSRKLSPVLDFKFLPLENSRLY